MNGHDVTGGGSGPGRGTAPGAGTGRAGHAERVARAALTRLLEPGSVLGSTAVRVWGPERALQVLTGRDPAGPDERQELSLVLSGEGATFTDRAWTKALSGWAARASGLAPERDLDALSRLGGGLLIPGDPGWPESLADLGPAAPVALWFRGPGPVPRLDTTLAVIGSRDATAYGQSVTRTLAGGAAARGLTVLSGGAYGIDGAAHRVALASGKGTPPTSAVLAGGLDRYYPAGHEDLLREVAASGVLLSELPPGASPTRYRFLARNRLIAALSGAVLVIEARWRSGAQNTAGHALGLGREVGVVPGPVTSSQSAGCHRLLRESPAVLVTDLEETLALMPGTTGSAGRRSPGDGTDSMDSPDSGESAPPRIHDHLTVEELLVYEALPLRTAAPVDRLCSVAGLGPGTVMGTLKRLQRQGLAEQRETGWRRAPASQG